MHRKVRPSDAGFRYESRSWRNGSKLGDDYMTPISYLGRHASLFLMAGMFAGIFLPQLGRPLVPALPWLIIALLVIAMMRVDIAELLLHARNPLRLAASLFGLMVLTPIVVHFLLIPLGLPPIWHLALVMAACAPSLGSLPNLAYIMRLDGAIALNVLVIGTLVFPFSAALLLPLLSDTDVNLDAWGLFSGLAIKIGVAILIAMVLRRLMGAELRERLSTDLDGLSVLILVLFVLTVMSDIGTAWIKSPMRVISMMLLVMAFNFGLQFITSVLAVLLGRGLTRAQALSLGLSGGNRNFALFFLALPPDMLPQFLLFLGVFQIPIYLTPLLTGPLYRKALRS